MFFFSWVMEIVTIRKFTLIITSKYIALVIKLKSLGVVNESRRIIEKGDRISKEIAINFATVAITIGVKVTTLLVIDFVSLIVA